MNKTADNPAIGGDALDFIDMLLTKEEIAESNLRVALIGERIEDEYDLKAYEEAMAEFKKNPVTYSHEEVWSELDDLQK